MVKIKSKNSEQKRSLQEIPVPREQRLFTWRKRLVAERSLSKLSVPTHTVGD